ncbi:SH3 domain [Phytophthora infestans]|uniref:SH3 domain n=1 Tax=Phytophthora infestans TaxID=4787 RepID=A0A833W3D4_PHYIN|nr:SH3 domain [Phytophthora infestans]KAF4145187.1 SH3 domain [Phytophthora infestans]
MPSFCPKCGDFVEEDACGKCGEKAVTTQENPWKAASKEPGGDKMSVPAVPTAFTAAARIKMMGVQPVPEPARKEQAIARFNFVPQDTSTQLALSKGDEVDVVRKDNDGWWFVIKDGEKGLVPGSYLHIENPIIPVTDAAILAAREASNQRFMELQRTTGGAGQSAEAGVEYQSPLGLEALAIADSCAPKPPNGPARGADAKSGGTEFKPGEVRKLRKCYACKETILGRTKVCKDQIFHEICLLCKGCRESIEEDEDFTLIKKKAYHADCAKDVNHCFVCDKEILGRVYRAGDGAFHKLCMVCSVCNKQSKEAGAKLENDLLVCGECVAEKERKEREEREAALERERAAAKAKAEKEAALAAARALEEEKERKAQEAQKAAEEAARAKAKAEAKAAAAARAQAEREAAEAVAIQRAAAAAVAKGNGRSGTDSLRSSTSNLDEFDLEATPIDMSGHNGRISEVSDIDSLLSDGDYAGYMGNGQRESLRLSEVLDLESFDEDRLSDLSGISEGAGERSKQRRSTVERTVNENAETFSEDEDDRELCGGCGLVLEGEAVGALNQYFHYECFKCSYCSRVIAEDDGYAEKDNQAFHQGCYQARFGKKCHRCEKVLKGKVVKALDHLYHPDCFVCYQCSASLSAESFFEHEGQAVCAKCKHEAIALDEPSLSENMAPVAKGIAGYRFDAQDDTQLTIYPGDEVTILQKDDDGWWLVDLRNKRGYVPGSYLIERPIEEPKPQPKKKKSAFKSKPKRKPGLCSSCSTQNPAEARFCRSCGNNLMA